MAALGVNVSSSDLDSYLAFRRLNTLKGFKLIDFISSFQHEENLEMKKHHKYSNSLEKLQVQIKNNMARFDEKMDTLKDQ